MFLEKNSVYVWHVVWKDYLHYKDVFWTILSLSEKKRAHQLLLASHKQQFIVTRGILRILIGYLLNQAPHAIAFTYTAAQKPQVINKQDLEFNISHTNNDVLYGFCLHTKIGIDIEDKVRKINIKSLASHYFSVRENAQLALVANNLRLKAFLTGWSQKEAISKAYGLGLQMRFRQIEVNIKKGEPRLIQIHHRAFKHLKFLLYCVTIPNCYAVIAIHTLEKTFRIFHMKPIEHEFVRKMIASP